MRLLVVAVIWLLITIGAFIFYGDTPPSASDEDSLSFWILAPGRGLSVRVSGEPGGGSGGWTRAPIVVVGSWLTWTLLTFFMGESARFTLRYLRRGRAK
jgi:hypothetical protein